MPQQAAASPSPRPAPFRPLQSVPAADYVAAVLRLDEAVMELERVAGERDDWKRRAIEHGAHGAA